VVCPHAQSRVRREVRSASHCPIRDFERDTRFVTS
jgi:hypothetical protein